MPQEVVQLGSFAAAASQNDSVTFQHQRQRNFAPSGPVQNPLGPTDRTRKALLADAEPLLTNFRALKQRVASLAAAGQTQVSVTPLLSIETIFSRLDFCPPQHCTLALSEYPLRQNSRTLSLKRRCKQCIQNCSLNEFILLYCHFLCTVARERTGGQR